MVGFFSSVLLTQPLKVTLIVLFTKSNTLRLQIICLAIFVAFFCRKSDEDTEANEYLDDTQYDLENDEEYLHLTQVSSLMDSDIKEKKILPNFRIDLYLLIDLVLVSIV